MLEIALPCSCCGNLITHTEDVAVRECAACGMPNARPVAVEASADILRHAVRQRLGCDFANAERSYQHVLLEHPDESEALWGRLLCHYGVEYVKDPATGRLTPTVHTVRRKPLRLQPEFRDACAFAPDEVRARYEREAAYIDDAQAAIRVAAASCPPYDVFLCHKTTRPGTGEKTEDFHRATQLYYYLREQGLRPFFAPESLTGLAGADYEAGIYHAIDTAKVMLVLCSDKDWLTSAWVRSEWSRFIERIDDGADKRIVPLLYDHFNPAQLPPEFRFRRMQGFPMGELTSTEKLMALIREAVGKEEPVPRPEEPARDAAPAPEAEKPAPEMTFVPPVQGDVSAPVPEKSARETVPVPVAEKPAAAAVTIPPVREETTTQAVKPLQKKTASASAPAPHEKAPLAPPMQAKTDRAVPKKAPEMASPEVRGRTAAVSQHTEMPKHGAASGKPWAANVPGNAEIPRRPAWISAAIRNARVGDWIEFGRCTQKNGKKKSIQWLVLSREKGRVLIISRDLLDNRCYNIAAAATDWAHCSLRQWLNDEFFRTTFSSEEQQVIQETPIHADMNPYYDVDSGRTVYDRVFLLSSTEARMYFKTNFARCCMGGFWASGEWWLRTPGEKQDRAALVMRDGSIRDRGIGVHNTAAVRPALWITLGE